MSCLRGSRWPTIHRLMILVGILLILQEIPDEVDGFVNNPKIITRDGNLIFEAGLNRNITFRLNGSSRLTINDELDVINLLLSNEKRRGIGVAGTGLDLPDSNGDTLRKLSSDLSTLRTQVFGDRGLNKRLRNLQNRTRSAIQLIRRYSQTLRRLDGKVQTLTASLEADHCQSNPCQNGGTCYNMFKGFQCKCTQYFEGTTCEKDINECALYAGTDLGCQNGGQCINKIGGYSCLCPIPWIGIHCVQRKGDCMQSSNWELCGHGTCVNTNDINFGYKCICDVGWKTNSLTPSCLTDVDECSESQTSCQTKCLNLPGSFTCTPCGAGLTGNGISCRDIDECQTDNGGCSMSPRVPCINTYGSHYCGECPLGWSGDGRSCVRETSSGNENNGLVIGGGGRCSGANICHPSALCMEISNTVVCNCPQGTVGNGIGPNGCVWATSKNCSPDLCKNGGTCIDTGTDYRCLCLAGFFGRNCSTNPCLPNPCHNAGSCLPLADGTSVKCQCPPGYSGRLCENRFSRCGGLLVGLTGSLKYPDGSIYEHNAQCAWVIRTDETKVLNVTFNAFELEDSTECRFDWLQINDGRTAASRIIGRFCGTHKPLGGNIIASTNQLYLWFRSDNSTAREGFDLEWSSIPPQCGGVIEIESHGTIATPGSPGNYPKNRDCEWKLRAPNNKRIKLTFFSLDIENHDSCNYDYVEIIDSASNTVLEKFCNTSHPSPLMLPTNEATIHFHSDNEGGDNGFQIYYALEERIPGCGGTYTAKQGIISSPVVLQEYLSCEYDIKMLGSETITVDFTHYELGPEDCIELYDVEPLHNTRSLQSKYCGKYGITPASFTSMYNALHINFYSRGGKFRLQYKADCSYTFEANEGEISSPGYPHVDNSEQFCSYKILTEPDTVISLNFIDFDLDDSSLENDGSCMYTSLAISVGVLEHHGPFCGNNTPPRDEVYRSNMIVLQFVSGEISRGRGFKLRYKASAVGRNDCGGIYTKPGQTIRLPTTSEGTYKTDMECYFVIMAPRDKGVMLNWKSFDLEDASDCNYDYVEIYDNIATKDQDKHLGRYCGTTFPPSIVTHARMITLKFVSDFSDNNKGFEVTYDFVDVSNRCGGIIHSSSGRINSPEWPENYTNGVDCIWTIAAPVGVQIELQIEKFELEDSTNCDHDWLEVRNGASNRSSMVGRFCGKSIPHDIPSFTNHLYVHFHSDEFISAAGFVIRWHVFSNGCGGHLKSPEGVITSPNYPNPYPGSAECEWQIIVPKGSIIHITIEDLALERLLSCHYDRLEIYDGTTDILPSMKICEKDETNSTDALPQFISTTNKAIVRFRSDNSINERGFMLSYRTNCTFTLTETFGAIESLNYENRNYRDDVNCRWTIKAPKGNRISLEFTLFDKVDKKAGVMFTEPYKNGSSKSLIVGDGAPYFTDGDTLIITHNDSLARFRLEYSVIGCVQLLQKDSGELQSPLYPKMYPNDIECVWEIRTTPGQGIKLTVHDMDIEETINCTKDALQVSSIANSHNPKERHCGKQEELIVSSSGHRMFVRFFSDAQHNGKGFNATYITTKTTCGGVVKSKNGVITSPNYPLDYPNRADCEWAITVTRQHTITFTIDDLILEDTYECESDYVALYDDEADRNLFKACTSTDSVEDDRDPVTIVTKSNMATLRFVTDADITAKGFSISFHENCGKDITISDYDYDYISVKRYSRTNETCVFHLVSANDKHVMVTPAQVQTHILTDLSTQNEDDCMNRGVKIYDGPSNDSPLVSKFCKKHPPALISNSNQFTVEVNLNVIAEFEMIYELMDSQCGGQYDAMQGTFASPYYPSSYPVNVNCEWYIGVARGNSLVLTIEKLDLEPSDDCNNDYLEVRESDERGRLLGLFCGANEPPPIKGYQQLWLKFNSDNDNVGFGFLATYNYATHNEISGVNGVIESPKYPDKFETATPFSWRVTVDNNYVVLLTIKHLRDVDVPFIQFFDGYSNIGAPIDVSNSHVIRSNTNVLYFTASRGPFQFEWERLSKDIVRSNRTAEEISRQCGKNTVTINSIMVFKSPGYPWGYADNLNCSWTFIPADRATHSVVQFMEINLEEISDCFADYVTVSSSSDLENWKVLDKLCKTPEQASTKLYHGTPYLRLQFNTDVGVNKTGFMAFVKTACGSLLTDPRGFVNATRPMAWISTPLECVWNIRVRQGRRIRLTFIDSTLRKPDAPADMCGSFFLVRNGMAEDSPFLGKGKYCDNNITDVLETSSNQAYVKFVHNRFPGVKASFHYEEISHECSEEIVLSDETMIDRTRSIATPNYPNIPHPHSECIWKVTAPIHHVIAVDFVERFDLALSDNCQREYVQINDGSSELMPLLGVYCGLTKPNTKYSTANVMRIKYFSDTSEPHLGFKANLSIGRCGGLYYSDSGVIESPKTPILRERETEFECVYTVQLDMGNTVNLTIETMELPDESDSGCSGVSHLELQEVDTYGEEENITDTLVLCGSRKDARYTIETNKLVIRYRIKAALPLREMFRISYSAIGARCGETIVATRGMLLTPGYPGGVTRPTHCSWRLRVPKGRRIRVEFLDFDTGASRSVNGSSSFGRFRGRLTFANDFSMHSIIARISDNPPEVLYSTDNTMAIDAFLLSFSRHRGFKLRFSSDEPSVACRDSFNLNESSKIQIRRSSSNDTFYCNYDLKVGQQETLVLRVAKYEANLTTRDTRAFICKWGSPLRIEFNEEFLLPNMLCENYTHTPVRLPFPVKMTLSGHKRNHLIALDLELQRFKCGGIVSLFGENLTITQPESSDYAVGSRLECAWVVWPNKDFTVDDYIGDLDDYMVGVQIEVTISVDFKGKCDEQYLLVYNGPNQNAPHLGRYCGQSAPITAIVERGLFFEYYTESYERQSKFNVSIQQGSGCGGVITLPFRDIVFAEQYKNNVECVWEIKTEPGFHLGLTFEGRFFIESSAGCKKDYLRIEQNTYDGDWQELQTLCGRNPPSAVNTTTTEMRLIFHSDGDTLGDGFTAHFDRNCGGLFYASSEVQQISSPGYPIAYANNLYCNYTILPLPADVGSGGMIVRFSDFQLEFSPHGCMFDNVTIYTADDDYETKETTICGASTLREFRGLKSISVVFRSDYSFNSKGFQFEYGKNVCGGVITNSTIIRSPRHQSSNTFPPKSNCFWNLTAPEGYKILIKFEELDFEGHIVCAYDSVEVYKGLAPVLDQRLAQFCGNLTGSLPMLSIPSNTALIRSFSDDNEASRGFTALVSFRPNCDRHIFLGGSNSSYEMNTYAGGYSNNLDCSFIFSTESGRQLSVSFSNFHVEDSPGCTNDYLEMRDGNGPFSDEIGRFCGHDVPSGAMSSGKALYMRFVSDAQQTSSGFSARVSSQPLICGQPNLEVKENEKITLTSPSDSSGHYLKNLNCLWKISSEKTIHLKFDRFDVKASNTNDSCDEDYLKIYNHDDASAIEKGFGSEAVFNGRSSRATWYNYALEHIYCGNQLPDDYFSNGKIIYMKFHTNGEEKTKNGFSITAMQVNGCFRNFTGTQGRIQISESVDHCDIYIMAPENYTLTLYYKSASFSEYDCSREYLEAFDVHTNKSLQKICEYMEAGKSLFSSTNALRLRLKLDGLYTQFDLTYLASRDGPGCGGDLYNYAGIITNPFYPRNVRSNSDCRWNIRVPSNLKVYLVFDAFDLGAKITCRSDYLQIIEHQEDGSEKIMRQFCGEDNPKDYKSERSYLTVRFHKTVNYDGTGWAISFNGVYADYKPSIH